MQSYSVDKLHKSHYYNYYYRSQITSPRVKNKKYDSRRSRACSLHAVTSSVVLYTSKYKKVDILPIYGIRDLTF